MTRIRLLLIGAAAMTCVAVAPVAGLTAAADGSGLVVSGRTPIRAAWSDFAGDGVPVSVCNTASTGTTVRGQLSADDVDDDPTIAEIQVAPAKLAVRAGDCAEVSLRLAPGVPATNNLQADVKARLVLVSTVGSATVDVTVSGKATVPAIVGAIGDATLTATKTWIGGSSAFGHGRDVIYVKTDGLPPPPTPDSYKKSATLVSGSHSGRVTVDSLQPVTSGKSTATSSDNAVALHLSWSGEKAVGTYKGTLPLGGDKGQIPVTVIVTDPFWVLVACLVVGLVIAFLLRWTAGRWRYQLRAFRVRRSLPDKFEKALAHWTAFSEPAHKRALKADIAAFNATSKARLHDYLRTVALVDPTDPAYVSVVDNLAAVVADATCLETDLRTTLRGLQRQVSALEEWLSANVPGAQQPDVLNAARVLLTSDDKHALKVGDATKIQAEAQAQTTLLQAWQDAAHDVVRHTRWLGRIPADDADAAWRDFAGVELQRAMFALYDADTAAEVTAVVTSTWMANARDIVEVLGSKHGVWMSDDAPTAEEQTAIVEHLLLNQRAVTVPTLRLGHVVDGLGTWVATHVPAAGSKLGDLLAGFAAALVAFLVALWTTWQTLYDGKAYGGVKDYLATIAAGIALSAVVDALVSGAAWARGGIAALRARP